MSKAIRIIENWWWKWLIIAIAVSLHINLAGCYKSFFEMFSVSDIPVDVSAERFAARFEALQQEFGEDVVILEEIVTQDKPKQTSLRGYIKLPEELGKIKIDLFNYGDVDNNQHRSDSKISGRESYTLEIITPPASTLKSSLPDYKMINIASKAVGILSDGEITYEEMLEDFYYACVREAEKYSGPEYVTKYWETDCRFILHDYNIGRTDWDGFDIVPRKTEDGKFYTETFIQFLYYD